MFLVPFFDLQNFILLVRTVPFLRKIFFISSYTAKNNYFLLYELIQDLPYRLKLWYTKMMHNQRVFNLYVYTLYIPVNVFSVMWGGRFSVFIYLTSTKNGIKSLAKEHKTAPPGESRTSNPSIHCLILKKLSHSSPCAACLPDIWFILYS